MIFFVVIMATVFDALRDRFYPRLANAWPRWTKEQWCWHVFKWIAFYSPLVYITWDLHIYEKLLWALFCFILWRVAYHGGRFPSQQFLFFSRSTDVLPTTTPEDEESRF